VELQLSGPRLLSPLDNIVIIKRLEVGDCLQRGQPLLVLANPHPLWAVTHRRESEIAPDKGPPLMGMQGSARNLSCGAKRSL
jgi:multidrug resistance efflux pump